MGKCEQYHGEESKCSVYRCCESKSSFVAEYIKDKQYAKKGYAQPEKVCYISCRSKSIGSILVEFDIDLLTESPYKLLAVVAED
jgi:hypothetical protein